MPFTDPARKREYQREWVRRQIERHRINSRAGVKRWRKRHRDEHLAYRRAHYAANSERVLAQIAAWRAAHPETHRVSKLRRRAREASATGSFTTSEWTALLKRWGQRCAYCGAPGRLQADHRTPLIRGGTGWIENILPACGRCNQRKHLLTEDEFRRRLEDDGLCWLTSSLHSTPTTLAG
jgi:5-methylcytosine-specific restriction endonuclease McrA